MVKVGVCGWGSSQLSSNCTIISFFDSEQPILLTLHTQPQKCEVTLERSGVKMGIAGDLGSLPPISLIDLTFSHRWAEFGLQCVSRLERVRTVCCVSKKKNFPGPWGSFLFAGITYQVSTP